MLTVYISMGVTRLLKFCNIEDIWKSYSKVLYSTNNPLFHGWKCLTVNIVSRKPAFSASLILPLCVHVIKQDWLLQCWSHELLHLFHDTCFVIFHHCLVEFVHTYLLIYVWWTHFVWEGYPQHRADLKK